MKFIEDLSQKHEELLNENINLNNINNDLQTQLDALTDDNIEYETLVEENAELKDQILQLRDLWLLEKKKNESTDQDLMHNDNNEKVYVEVTSANGAKIRSAPDSSSDMIGGAERGKRLLLLNIDTVMGSDGYKWYEILVNNKMNGYVRSDVVIIAE